MEDSEILELYNAGEKRQAFNLVIRKYGERLYLHVRQMTLCHEDADDCLQNTFVRAWEAMETFRGDSGLYTWLYRIATNETINFLRRQRVRTFLKSDNVLSRIEDDPSFNGDKLQLALQKAISKLPPRQRAVFTMRYYEEIPYGEMSEILGTSESSLKASYHFACKKVKEWVLNFSED